MAATLAGHRAAEPVDRPTSVACCSANAADPVTNQRLILSRHQLSWRQQDRDGDPTPRARRGWLPKDVATPHSERNVVLASDKGEEAVKLHGAKARRDVLTVLPGRSGGVKALQRAIMRQPVEGRRQRLHAISLTPSLTPSVKIRRPGEDKGMAEDGVPFYLYIAGLLRHFRIVSESWRRLRPAGPQLEHGSLQSMAEAAPRSEALG